MTEMRSLLKLCGVLWIFVCFLDCADGDIDWSEWEACSVDGVRGACVPLSACAQYVLLLKESSSTDEGLRVTAARRCGFHGLEAKVCCPVNEPLISTTDATTPEDIDPDDFVDFLPKPGECGRSLLESFIGVEDHYFPPPLPPQKDFSFESPVYASDYIPIQDRLKNTPNKSGLVAVISPLPSPKSVSDGPLPDPPQPWPPTPYSYDGVTSHFFPNQAPAIDGGAPVHSRDGAPTIGGGAPVFSRDMALWMALLGYRNSAVFWKCGGSIISARHVLTAAHCVQPNLYIVRVGEIDLANDHQTYSPIDILVKKTIAHEQYRTYHNDIGIVVLQDRINFYDNPHIAPVCLPSSPEDQILYFLMHSNRGLITGWGETERAGQRPNHLLYAHVAILPLSLCADAYRAKNVTIDARVLCAGDAQAQTDACNGDSGGPLVNDLRLPNKEGITTKVYYQLGIVSYGFRCTARRHTGVYTNVTHFMPWIEEKVLGRHGSWAVTQ